MVLFALLGGGLSLSLLMHYHGIGPGGGIIEKICGAEAGTGCSAVEASGYSAVMGFPVAALGIIYYISLALLYMLLYFADGDVRGFGQTLGYRAIMLGLLVDLVLLCVQVFLIGQFCTVCILTYGCTLMMMLLVGRSRRHPPGSTWASVIGSREGRITLVSFSQGLVILIVAVIMTNNAFSNADARNLEARLMEQAVAEYAASPTLQVSTGDAPSMGRSDAPIQIVVFSDFLCPYCRETAQYFRRHMDAWQDRARITFLNYPLDRLCNPYLKTTVHSGSCWGALGGLCAQQQNRFWEFHDRLFSDPPRNPTGQDIMKIAFAAGIDTTVMKSCMISPGMRGAVQSQITRANALGVTGTPRIFINGKPVTKLAALSGILKSEASRLGLKPLEGVDD